MGFRLGRRRELLRARLEMGAVTVWDGGKVYRTPIKLDADPTVVLRNLGYRLARWGWPRISPDGRPIEVLVRRRHPLFADLLGD